MTRRSTTFVMAVGLFIVVGAVAFGTLVGAHQDDDILFMNPDLSADIAERRCIRTVYITAGDSGAGEGYWHSREQGAKAAYAQMYGSKDNSWRDERQMINGRFVTVAFDRNGIVDGPGVDFTVFENPLVRFGSSRRSR